MTSGRHMLDRGREPLPIALGVPDEEASRPCANFRLLPNHSVVWQATTQALHPLHAFEVDLERELLVRAGAQKQASNRSVILLLSWNVTSEGSSAACHWLNCSTAAKRLLFFEKATGQSNSALAINDRQSAVLTATRPHNRSAENVRQPIAFVEGDRDGASTDRVASATTSAGPQSTRAGSSRERIRRFRLPSLRQGSVPSNGNRCSGLQSQRLAEGFGRPADSNKNCAIGECRQTSYAAGEGCNIGTDQKRCEARN